MNRITVVFSIDHNYVMHCASTMLSVVKSYKATEPVRFIITHDDLAERDKNDLRSVITDNRFSVEFISIDPKMFKDMPVGGDTISDAITLSTYYRIGYASILPKEIKKIIYLDSDIYVNDSIDKLWNISMDGYAIAGVPEPETTMEGKRKRLGIPYGFKYVNAGVSIMNLEVMRNIHYPAKAIEYARVNHDKIIYHDQDIANALLYDKTLYLPYKWNIMDYYLYKKPPLTGDALMQAVAARECPSLIHYAGYVKPWHKECRNPYRHLYWDALKATKWQHCRKTFRHGSFIKEMKLLVKLLIKPNPYFK